MTDTKVKATVDREQRTDRAERTLTVEGAPPFAYQARISYRNRSLKTVEWVARTVRLTWDRGVLRSVHVAGVKLKSDGTPGMLRDRITFPVEVVGGGASPQYNVLSQRHDGQTINDDTRTPPPAWLLQLVEDHKIAPPFKSLSQVGA
jgi:hypothetical protein